MAGLEGALFWQGFERELQTLLLDGVGIAVFALLVHLFYKNLSRRNLSHRHEGRPTRALVVAVLFPLMSFGFFLVIAISLFVLSKQQGVGEILLIGMGVTAAVRIAAYVSESSAEDLAKMIPLGLLAVVLVQPGYLTLETTVARLEELAAMAGTVVRYFLFLVVLEVVLRAGCTIVGGRRTARRAGAEPPPPGAPAQGKH